MVCVGVQRSQYEICGDQMAIVNIDKAIAEFKQMDLNKKDKFLTKQVLLAITESPQSKIAQKILMQIIGLDKLNLIYYLSLLEQKFSPEIRPMMKIADDISHQNDGKFKLVFPTAIASAEQLKELPLTEFENLLTNEEIYINKARSTRVLIKKLQAGTGSSIKRKKYLAQNQNISEDQVRIGAKGTDLFIPVGDPHSSNQPKMICLAEAQILQAVNLMKSGQFGAIAWKDIVSDETKEGISALWTKSSLLNPKLTYKELWDNLKGLDHVGILKQSLIPTFNENSQVTLLRKAPGGHGLFAFESLLEALRYKESADDMPTIAVVSNGEDLGSSPPPELIGFMVEEAIPVVMVTTDKTDLDIKGGQISLIAEKSGSFSVTILERAQAEEANQLSLFENLGLKQYRPEDNKAYFNTNMALFNYSVLSKKLNKLVDDVGIDALRPIIAPELISNCKEQKNPYSNRMQKYLQLEGAMGSVLLNLNRYWKKNYSESLVQFVNIGIEKRTSVFSPVKTAFDFFMQFYSDRFSLDDKMILRNLRPGEILAVRLVDPKGIQGFYSDVSNVLEVFVGASILDVDELTVEGLVGLSGIIFQGKVEIISKLTAIHNLCDLLMKSTDLNKNIIKKDDALCLRNVRVIVNRNGSASTEPV
jgi:hypothetical protein